MDRTSFARVGVVIVTYASAGDITNALQALPTGELARVVVVDNASPDDTVSVVRSLGLPNVTIIEQANLGFGAGNDAGRANLPPGVDFVLFLNPDCMIETSDIARLVSYLDAHPTCGLVGPRLRDADGSPRTPAGALPTPLTELQPHLPKLIGRFVPRRQLDANVSRSQSVGYVEGACMLVRASVFDEIGGFDHRYFLCFEEMDLARRLGDAGCGAAVCADAWATHAGQQSRAQTPQFSLYHQYRSQRLYLERWYGLAAATRYARVARLSWWARRRLGRLDDAEYSTLRAAISGAELPE